MPEFVDNIIVVDDRSTDATLERCREWQERMGRRLTVIEQPKNQGVGAAITKGYQSALDLGIDVVAVMAGDGQMDPMDLTLIIDPVINGKADYSKGNRLFTGEAWRKTPHVRYLGNAFLSMLTKIASGYWHVADSQSGFTAISRTALKTLELDRLYPSYGYPNDLLIQLNIHNFRVADVPVHPRRERNIRNRFANVRGGGVLEAALKLKPSSILEALTHPGWVYDYVKNGGAPTMGNWVPHAANGASVAEVIQFGRTQTPAAAQTWRDLERYRRQFPRTLIVKGILNPLDAIRAAEIGCDGVIVSNHGGRQLDQAPASLDMLPAIKAAVGDRMTVMLDSGVRRGADILIALCLGADFCFFGRPTLYGAVAGGLPGVKKAVDIFRGEIDLVMGQIGCPSLDQLGPDFLWQDDWPRNR